ncbi:MAG: polymer-forming cytoskeletal protein [Shewanella fodinae]|nr:polymer-forming cytoskeletal protein [Shewanella fodinae]
MAKPAPRKDGGYVLITVLVLALAASLVTFVSIKESRLQERMSGNQQKMVNAHQAAEKGVYETITLINNLLANNATIAQIQGDIARSGGAGGQNFVISDVSYSAPNLRFLSKGTFQDASAYLKTNFQVTTGVSPFSGGVVACERLQLSGSGTINSYDPTKGNADASGNDRSNARVKVIDGKNQQVRLDGNAPIQGEVQIRNGSLMVNGSSHISGDVKVSGSVELSPSAQIYGNLQTGSYLKMGPSANIGGDVSAVGNVELSSSSHIQGSVQTGGNYAMQSSAEVGGSVSVAGNVTDLGWNSKADSLTHAGTRPSLQSGQFTTTKPDGLVQAAVSSPAAPAISSEDCDPLDIQAKLSPFSSLTPVSTIQSEHSNNNTQASYSFNGNSGQAYSTDNYNSNTAPKIDITPVTMDVLGQQKPVYVLDNLVLDNASMNITSGDVVIYVKNNTKIEGGGSGIHVADGATLTILTPGKVEFGSSGKVTTDATGAATSSNKPPISIYSSYSDGGTGIDVKEAGQVAYAAIYAPYTHAEVKNGTAFSGAVRAKSITVNGAGKLHYDESLEQVKAGSTGSSLNLISLLDYYPN